MSSAWAVREEAVRRRRQSPELGGTADRPGRCLEVDQLLRLQQIEMLADRHGRDAHCLGQHLRILWTETLQQVQNGAARAGLGRFPRAWHRSFLKKILENLKASG